MNDRTELRYLVSEVDERAGIRQLPLLSVSIHSGVVPRSNLTDDEPRAADLSNYKMCAPGDIVVNRMRAFQGAIGTSDVEGLVSPDYMVLRSHGSEPAFLNHLFRSDWFVGEMTSRIRGIGSVDLGSARTPRINAADFLGISVPMPSIDEQRRIADFLDDQVARIDNIIGARESQLAALTEAILAKAADLLTGLDAVGAPLGVCTEVIDTEHRTAPIAEGGSYWVAGTSAIRDGVVVESLLRPIDHETYYEWTRRGAPRPGDILLTREAPVGQIALLGSIGAKLAIGQRVVLLKPSEVVVPDYLRLVLMSSVFDRVIAEAVQGSLHPHLNMTTIGRVRVPMSDTKLQHELGAAYSSFLVKTRSTRLKYENLTASLHELKRSLITSAISGEFDVSAADGSRVAV